VLRSLPVISSCLPLAYFYLCSSRPLSPICILVSLFRVFVSPFMPSPIACFQFLSYMVPLTCFVLLFSSCVRVCLIKMFTHSVFLFDCNIGVCFIVVASSVLLYVVYLLCIYMFTMCLLLLCFLFHEVSISCSS